MITNNTIYQIKRKDSQTSALSRVVEYRKIRSREIVNLTVNAIQAGGKLEKTILHSDLTNLIQSIGIVQTGSTIQKIVVDVIEVFETQMTIGSMSAQGILTTLNDVNLARIGTYTIENFVKFNSTIELFAFFGSASSTGNLKIIIFYT